MAINPLDVLRVTAKFSLGGVTMMNTYELIHAGVASVTEAAAQAAIATWMNTAYASVQPHMSDALSFSEIDVINVTQGTPVGLSAWPTLTVGGSSAQASPLQICYLVRFPTNYLGSQGRKFIPGLTESTLDAAGFITGLATGALTNYAFEIVNGLLISGEDFVSGNNNVLKARFAAYTGAVVNAIVSTQRRRKQGVGI